MHRCSLYCQIYLDKTLIYRHALLKDNGWYIANMSVWSSGMIVRSGRTGPGFDSRNGPFFKTKSLMTHLTPRKRVVNLNFKTRHDMARCHISILKINFHLRLGLSSQKLVGLKVAVLKNIEASIRMMA